MRRIGLATRRVGRLPRPRLAVASQALTSARYDAVYLAPPQLAPSSGHLLLKAQVQLDVGACRAALGKRIGRAQRAVGPRW